MKGERGEVREDGGTLSCGSGSHFSCGSRFKLFIVEERKQSFFKIFNFFLNLTKLVMCNFLINTAGVGVKNKG